MLQTIEFPQVALNINLFEGPLYYTISDEKSHFDCELCILFFPTSLIKNYTFITQFKFSSLVSLHSPFSSLVMQTPIFLIKLSDERIIFISDVGKM
jgi:hypothetical protein